MKKKIKNYFKTRSKLLGVIAVLEMLFSTYILLFFNYTDQKGYTTSMLNSPALLMESLISSTWKAQLVLILLLISIFTLITLLYKDEKFELMSIILLFFVSLLTINYKDTLINNIVNQLLFIPVVIIKIFAFINQKKLSQKA